MASLSVQWFKISHAYWYFSTYFFPGFFFLPMFKPASSRSSKFSSFFLLFFGLTGPAAAAGF